ncbi:tRNA (adenine(58)-N(1))-methyltransferase, mitochondrial [Anomaloglossus baeobatrachus]|uniref:tRNA (adenine(58)-N(1))-methyltransferase, mitochondrial n=1 Tax=Anomaloglossus baeobatrachus TaxID=238106 RepID=UPI003F50ABEA
MSALCAGRRLCCSAPLWCRAPPAGRARNLRGQLQHYINLCSASKEGHGAEGQPEPPQPTGPPGTRTWRRRRSLSPLDRVSRMIPPEFISQEIRDLQSPQQLSPADPPSSYKDHPEPLRPPSYSKDHLEPLRPPSSYKDHPEPLRPPSYSKDHPEMLRPPSYSEDHPEPLRPQSSSKDHREPLRPLPSSEDHRELLRPLSYFKDHLQTLRTPSSSKEPLRPPPSSEDHPELLSPSSSYEDHPETLRPPSSTEDHPEPLRPPSSSEEPLRPASSYEDHSELLRPPSFSEELLRSSSSSEDHPELLRSPSSSQESGAHSFSQRLPSLESSSSHQEKLCCPPISLSPQDLAPSQGVPFQAGDLLLAEYKRRHYSMFRKMFVLKNSGKLVSNWGAINYKDLLGRLSGEEVRTSSGHQFFLRRPSLDEYVLYMKRGPTISYPKDIASMLMMMDLSPGDVVLEAGSGSGALSLFLSRAVGADGRVHSVELRSDHHNVSKRNFLQWKAAWEIRSGRSWPDNVNFINKDIREALSDLRSVGVDAVALDMLSPQVALPAMIGNLKQGGVCVVYIANITQVIDLLEGIRTCDLPLLCEKVTQVGITDWLVAPSLRKDGSVSKRVEPQGNWSSGTQTPEQEDDDDDDDGDTGDDDLIKRSDPFGQVPYIARPMPWQTGHTAFLVKLRKFKAAEQREPGGAD